MFIDQKSEKIYQYKSIGSDFNFKKKKNDNFDNIEKFYSRIFYIYQLNFHTHLTLKLSINM